MALCKTPVKDANFNRKFYFEKCMLFLSSIYIIMKYIKRAFFFQSKYDSFDAVNKSTLDRLIHTVAVKAQKANLEIVDFILVLN